MPIYEHECGRHGVFEALRAMSEASLAAPCPVCRDPSRRIVSAPRLALVGRSQAKAHERNERSQYEPRVVSADRVRPKERGPTRTIQGAGRRPWVLEHG
jgi:putative FmdB family regulatory protein